MGVPGSVYSVDDSALQERLAELIAALGDLSPAMEMIGEVGITSIEKNFESGGRPNRWAALKPATIERRKVRGHWPGQLLVETASLKKISKDVGTKSVVLSPGNVDYAAIQHFGGAAGRGRSATIPARAYMLLQEEDKVEIKGLLLDFIMEA